MDAAKNAEVALLYPNATILSNSSGTYNCHGYAWHKSNGGSTVWIGNTSTADEDVYWNDGSYVQVSPTVAPYATKVSYSSDDHSAVTTTNPNLFISKWGYWPLMQHSPTDTPYNSSTLVYYAIPITNGTNLVCSSATYQTLVPSSGFVTYNWAAGANLTPTSQVSSSNSFTVSRIPSNAGNSFVTVSMTSSCSGTTVSARKDLWVGPPLITNQKVNGGYYSPGMQICPGNHWLSVTPTGLNATTASWTVQSGVPYYVGTNTLNFTFYSSNSSVSISASSSNVCGTGSASFYLSKKTFGCSGSFSLTAFPNPTNDELNVESISDDPSVEAPLIDVALLLNSENKIVATGAKFSSKVKLDVRGLRKGTYYLQVSVIGGETFKEQIIIE